MTENIETACERTGTAYLRVVRQEIRRLEEEETITYVKSIREAVEYLEKTSEMCIRDRWMGSDQRSLVLL